MLMAVEVMILETVMLVTVMMLEHNDAESLAVNWVSAPWHQCSVTPSPLPLKDPPTSRYLKILLEA